MTDSLSHADLAIRRENELSPGADLAFSGLSTFFARR